MEMWLKGKMVKGNMFKTKYGENKIWFKGHVYK